MKINSELCIKCKKCIVYCSMGAIKENDEVVLIDSDECVECGSCLINAKCPVNAIYQDDLQWPRVLRGRFSNPKTPHPTTKRHGRGTEEMKTNDVTGKFKRGEIGISIELGRPGVGLRLRELEKVIVVLTKKGLEIERSNPIYSIIKDLSTGKLDPEVLNEKVLSVIAEAKFASEKLPEVLKITKKLAEETDNVFSLSLISRVEEDGSIPALEIARKAGFTPMANCKTNVGLGRPLAKEGVNQNDA